MTKTVLAAFPDSDDADRAIRELEGKGFSPEDISVITKENKRTVKAGDDEDDVALENTAVGASTGAAVGGLAGLLAGAGVIPALAGLLIGGPIAAALGLGGIAATTVSGAVTGALAGGLLGALTDLGLSAEEAKEYDTVINEGGVMVAVPAKNDDVDSVTSILEDNNATNVREVNLQPKS